MYKCYGCRRSFLLTSELVKHMRSNCRALAGSREFNCGQDSCARHFTSSSSLRKHLERHHRPRSDDYFCDGSERGNNTISTEVPLPHKDGVNCGSASSASQTSGPASVCTIEPYLVSFLSSLYSKPGVPRSIIQFVSVELSNLLRSSKEVFLNVLYQSLHAQNIDLPNNIKLVFEKILTDYASSGLQLTSEYRRFQWFENMGTLIPPREVTVGQRMEHRRTRIGLSRIPVPCTMQVIPMREVLQHFLAMPGVLKDVLETLELFKRDTDDVENIVQGEVWRDIMAREKDSHLNLPLILFFDDFEVGNPLGSHATIHKLGGVYLSLPFLPGHYVSQLDNIFILALFHASDRVTFGNNIVFQKVIEELNFLRNSGIYLTTDVFTGISKFHVVCVTGDNLGLNGILGFVESFSANHCCRICSVGKTQMQSMLIEDETLLRSAESYERDLLLHDPSATGVKERCIFLDALIGFRLFDHVAVDLLHDFLEGACRYVMSYVVEFLVKESKLVPLNIMQSKLAAFDYGPDLSSKPSNCLALDGNTLKLKASAAEMMTLVRYFGLLVGYYVPTGCEVWELFLYLRRILDRLINSRVSNDSSQQLKFWIAGLNELYIKLTKSKLKPKFHFLLHYPKMLLKFGPLTQVWTMRFEAKHRVSKITARASSSRVNICKTIAIKNQLVLNNIFIRNESFSKFYCGKKVKINADTVDYRVIKTKFSLQDCDLYSLRWVKINGHKLVISSIVTVDVCTDTFQPIFAEIKEIYVDHDNAVYLSCTMFRTVDFDMHYFAFNVCRTTESVCLKSTAVFSCVPNTLTIMTDHQLFVTVRMPLD